MSIPAQRFKFPIRDLRMVKIIGIGLASIGLPLLVASEYLSAPYDGYAGMFGVFAGLPGLFLFSLYLVRSRYAIFISERELIVHEPPLRDVVLRWDQIEKVIETGKHNLQFYDSLKQIGKVFAGIDNVHVIIAETRRRLRPEVYREAEPLMRRLEFKQEQTKQPKPAYPGS